MPGAEVLFNMPLTRLNPWYPGQFGVEGAWTDTGLRQHCTGTVFYVSPNHPGASDSRDGTDPNDPLLTIATAINRCESYRGDVIAVMQHGDWTYGPGTPYPTGIVESVTLDKHGTRLVGLAQGGLGVPWESADAGGFCLTVTATDCTIEGFCFTEGAAANPNGIYFTWDGSDVYGENGVVRFCTFSEGVDEGIKLNYSWYMHIHHNHFADCNDYGIWSDTGGAAPAEDPPSYGWFHDNVFSNIPGDGTGAAIWIPSADNMSIFRNAIFNDEAQAAAAATNEGIVTNDGVAAAGTRNMVWQNVFSCQNTAVAAGDYGDLNSGGGTDCWTQSYCMNGIAYAVP